ncbi:MAG: molybdopterin molybdotransferase MoeA [Spirochaetaceae bacterium]|jgi:molybdopterin molybdotransferase|nr:molybdopterin molybdotransferase MoeA [Spirochaetaceae bacterium]
MGQQEKIPAEEALNLVLGKVKPKDADLKIEIKDALGRVCAEKIFAPIDNPPFDRSPLDGYAMQSADTAGASAENPAQLRVAGTVYAGDVFAGKLGKGEAVRIMTGAMFPPDCDCMVMQENASIADGGKIVSVSAPVAAYENYIRAGEDIRKGQLLIEAGERLDFARLTILAAMGMDAVPVKALPVTGLLCTGDELAAAGKPLPTGKIYNSNETLIGSRLRELGFSPKTLPASGDDAGAVAAKIDSVIDELDALITTGAVSVGEKDIFHEVFNILGAEKLFWRLNSKPGGAILTGIYRGRPLMCLSGNPFAALTGFELIVKPVLGKIASRADLAINKRRVKLRENLPAKPVRRFIRARVENGEAAFPAEHLSGQIFSIAGCNSLLDIPAGAALEAGDETEALLF